MSQKNKIIITAIIGILLVIFGSQIRAQKSSKTKTQKVVLDTAKVKVIAADTLPPRTKLKAFKTKAHASYYADKFNGRKTASGTRFNNNKYTAAHRKLPFGTKLKVTNEANGKWLIVEVTDRGPFSRGRELDLTKRAFMDIASNKNSGVVIVKIEIVEK
ncbi:MAG: septal ring lytic transglycosylase RlpA family protein [Flavobacterium sp.]|jgi:rare lipoprotein A|nr:septal ring lytic transglycosylase RlpA family protein [Flavobacterium sp.]